MAVIQFKNVTLEYPVRENQSMTLKEFILRGLFFKLNKSAQKIKALDDVSLEINEGERVGIIGLNGAGKSTLLKTIGGIYPIESGQRIVEGTIGSLFDINCGFEPDATGWQNIYFRSYLQGDSPDVIKAKLKEIGDFTELGHFMDLPIRCYSTGMVMRLAFAIATSRCPEILLVDEILAAGDLVFMKKAHIRMSDFLTKARIVVVVSHHLEWLQNFCTRVIWMHHGKVYATGPAEQMIQSFKREVGELAHAA
jgi:lipopolysaccharide transport system ATP-binding protein